MAALAGTKRPFSSIHEQTEPQTVQVVESPLKHTSESPRRPSSRPTEHGTFTTPSVSPERLPSIVNVTRQFLNDASLVLVGVRGSGKSTLGVIASAFFQRRLVETHHAFFEVTGHSSSSYRKLFGPLQHRKKQLQVLTEVLSKHERGCVIVCGNEAMDRACQSLLRDYCNTHPVVQVLRDTESICAYLDGLESSKVRDLVRVGNKELNSCSNHEFFNVSDILVHEAMGTPDEHYTSLDARLRTPFLTLKKAERHFLKFVALITTQYSVAALEATYPLSSIAVEHRTFTYAVAVPLSRLAQGSLDKEQVEGGSDAIELIVDGELEVDPPTSTITEVSQVFADVRRSTIVPIIYHVDSQLGGYADASRRPTPAVISRELYLKAVMKGIRLAPEFLTVDLHLDDESIRKVIRAKGCAKIIGDLYMEVGSPAWSEFWWIERYQRAVSLGCDIVRLRKRAMPLEDNTALQSLRDRLAMSGNTTVPLIAYNTGYYGKFSAIMNPTLTTVDFEPKSKPSTVDPCVTARDCVAALAQCFVYDPMRFYIIGASITYSLSPSMHNAGFELSGLPHTYETHQTTSLSNIKTLIEDPFFGGASITLPFKIEVIALTHSLSQHATAIGAVNTLIPVRELRPDGSVPGSLELLKQRNKAGLPCLALYGENTDWIGIRACIRRGLSPVNAVRPQTTALVLGAGGMSRAAVYAMLQLGVKNIFIYNRTLSKAEQLAEYYQELVDASESNAASPLHDLANSLREVHIHVLPSKETPWPSAFRLPTIIVSCIPTHSIGSDPAPNFTLPPDWLQSSTGGVVLEVAYKTLHTPLLRQVRAEAHRGWVAMDGLDLLPEQGFAQFELFTGRRAPRRLMREQVLQKYRDSGVQDKGLLASRLARIHDEGP